MPRNDQVTRQWHLLRCLESSRGATLHELVDFIPDDYPKNARTVRRDLEALEAVGFPLITEQSDGQTRWRLMEGFRDIPVQGWPVKDDAKGSRHDRACRLDLELWQPGASRPARCTEAKGQGSGQTL